MKDKIRVAVMTILVLLLLAMAGGFWLFVGKQAQIEKEREEALAVKAMYVEIGSHGEYMFVQQEEGNEIPFTAEIPSDCLYEQKGSEQKPLSVEKLGTGDILKLYGEGIMSKSYPGEYAGVTKAVRLRMGNPEDADMYGEMLEEFVPKPIYSEGEGLLAP